MSTITTNIPKYLYLYNVKGEVTFGVATGSTPETGKVAESINEFDFTIVARNTVEASKLIIKHFKTGRVTVSNVREECKIDMIQDGGYGMYGGEKE
jgi:hypothetical protein